MKKGNRESWGRKRLQTGKWHGQEARVSSSSSEIIRAKLGWGPGDEER